MDERSKLLKEFGCLQGHVEEYIVAVAEYRRRLGDSHHGENELTPAEIEILIAEHDQRQRTFEQSIQRALDVIDCLSGLGENTGDLTLWLLSVPRRLGPSGAPGAEWRWIQK